MPERTGDNNSPWRYPTVYPGADLKLNVNAITLQDGLVEATGLDGRFLGALRPFPGMADATVHGVPKPSGSTTVTAINNIVFAKYAAVQKGFSRHTLKGIVYIADNPGGTGLAVYFAYRDSESGTSDVRMLEDFDVWTDFKLTSVEDYDITSLGKYIYLTVSGDTTSTVTSFQDKQPPYNKAYFWDFKVNDWDGFVTGFDGRFMGLLPERLLGTPINEDVGLLMSSDMMRSEVYSPAGTASDMPDVDYTYGVQLISRKHGIRSYLRLYTLNPGALAALRYRVSGINPVLDYSSFVQQLRGNSNETTPPIQWGMPHMDGFRLLRTPGDDVNMATGVYSPVFPLNQIDEYLELGAANYHTGSGAITVEIDHDIDPALLGDLSATVFSDSGLVSQPQFNPFTDVFGPAPRLRRLVAYDGLLVGVTDAKEPTSFSTKIKKNELIPESLVWSTLVLPEPENFPPENAYKVDDPAERFFALTPVGDHLFGVTNASIYRASRAGSDLAINRLQYRLGGVSRYGQTGVGNSLFIVTTSGMKEVDGNTGELRSVTAFDRVILDDSEWAESLGNVFVEFDSKIGALVVLNTSRQECYLLWESTGAVTKLVDVPWTFITSGPDVLTDGPHRVYFITDDAQVHCIDGARQMGKRSMCGTTIAETVNGTVTTGSSTNLIDSTATFPANCVGFKVYIHSGDRSGESATITVRNSATNLSISGLSGTLSVGDRYSVAPIITRVVLPQLVGQGADIDPFVRKIGQSISVAFSDLAGEVDGVNGKVLMGFKQNTTTLGTTEVDIDAVPDACVGYINRHSTRLFPFIEFRGGNLDYEIQGVLVDGQLSLSKNQSRQG